MKYVIGEYYDGIRSRPEEVQLEFTAKALSIHPANGASFSFKLDQVRVQPKIGSVPRVIDLPSNACVHVSDHKTLEEILPHKRDFIHILENNTKFVIGSFAGIVGFAFIMYFFVIPFTAKVLAPRMTKSFGERLTDETIGYLETSSLMEKETRQKYHDRLDSIRSFDIMAQASNYKFLLYSSKEVGANAFALPHDTIIVTTELLDLMEDDLEVLAVLLHEVGHVREYHVMQRVIGDSMVSLAMFALFGADWTSLPMVLLSTRYSRGVEREADMYAARLLMEHHFPPTLLAKALEKLDASFRKTHKGTEFLDFLSTHPKTKDRVNYLEKLETSTNKVQQ